MKATKPQLSDEQKVAAAASSPMARGLSATARLLSMIRDKAGELIDPMKRVCYPALATAHKHAHKHALRVSDPIHRVCYEPLRGHWERKYKARYPDHANALLILDLILAIIISALIVAGVFFSSFLPKPNLNEVALTVHAPKTSVSGSSISIGIDYTNLSSEETLPCAILTVDVPPAFAGATIALSGGALSEEANPSCQPTDTAPTAIAVPLPALAKGTTRTATLTGTPYGAAGTVLEVPAHFSYWVVGSTEPVIIPFHATISFASSAVSVDVTVPEKILRGAATAITLSYHNDSARPVPDTAVRFLPPADFVTTGSSQHAMSSGLWRLGDLEAGARGTITVYGYLRSVRDRVVSTSFGAELLMLSSATSPITASATRVNADSLSSGLTLTQEIKGAGDVHFLRPGDTVTMLLSVRNDGESTFTAGTLRLSLTDVLFMASPNAPTAWDVKTLPALAHIAPGDTVTAETTLTVLKDITPSVMNALGTDAAVASFSSLLTATSAENGSSDRIVTDTPTLDVPIVTALRLQAAGIYFTKEGDQIGRGPLPPTVGETTRYRVVMQIDNAQDAVNNTVVEAYLPVGVEWTGKFSVTEGEAIDYFPTTRRITWKIPTIDAFTLEHGTSPGASFEVALTPSTADAGKIPVLLTGLTVSGKDVITDIRISDRMGDITARLPFDFDDSRSIVAPAAPATPKRP